MPQSSVGWFFVIWAPRIRLGLGIVWGAVCATGWGMFMLTLGALVFAPLLAIAGLLVGDHFPRLPQIGGAGLFFLWVALGAMTALGMQEYAERKPGPH